MRQRDDGGRNAESEKGMAAAVATARRSKEELREDGGLGEAERAAAVGREEELEEELEVEGGEMPTRGWSRQKRRVRREVGQRTLWRPE